MTDILLAKDIPSLLLVIGIFLFANLIKGLAEFVWKIKKEKDAASEASIKELIFELKKFKVDLRRLYIATKMLAGDRWPQIKKEFMEDEDVK